MILCNSNSLKEIKTGQKEIERKREEVMGKDQEGERRGDKWLRVSACDSI